MKKCVLYSALLCLFSALNVFAQQPQWRLLEGSPSDGRFDDFSFININTGWGVSASGNSKIYKTTNSGLNWQLLYTFTGRHSRSICFIDSLTGFMGALTGAQHLFKTTNGGINWDSVPFASERPEGICGQSSFGNNLIGSGVYSGFPKVIWSTDRGNSWRVINLSSYADALIDCYLVNESEAFVIGGKGSEYSNRKAVILQTTDAGNSWVTRFTSAHTGNWGWKISFADPQTAYISIENFNYMDTPFFAKSTDGGLSWTERYFGTGGNYLHEGIGFVNESTGWIGTFNNVYETTNGGDTWNILNIGSPFTSINRFRFYNDTLGYAGGNRIFKYSVSKTIGLSSNQDYIPVRNSLHQNYPNPFNPVTKIQYEIFESSLSVIRIFNSAGEEVFTFYNGFRAPGVKEFYWYGTDNNGQLLPSGVYFYQLETENHTETKKMILVR